MIRRLNCPGCNRVLRLDDSLNVSAGQCPACGRKFRIPWAKSSTAPRPEPGPVIRQPRAVPPAPLPRESPRRETAFQAPQPPAPQPSRQKAFEEDEEGPSAYQLNLEDAPAPAPGNLVEAEVVDDEDDRDYDDDRPRRRKKRKKKRKSGGMSLEMSNFLITLGVVGVLWILLSVLVFLQPGTFLLVVLIGLAIGSLGQSWFIRIAFEDGIQTGLMCMFVPFYPLLYLLANLERAGKPFAIRMCGGLIVISALISAVAGSIVRVNDHDDVGPGRPVPGMRQGNFDDDD